MNGNPIRAIFQNAMRNAMQEMWGSRDGRYGSSPNWQNSAPIWNRPYDNGQNWNRQGQDWNRTPNNSIGFNQGQEYGSPGMRQGTASFNEREFGEEMKKYWRGLCDGSIEVPDDMAKAMCVMVAEAVKEHGFNTENGTGYGHDEEEHERYKEAIERLREASPNEKQKLMKELFEDDLTPDEQKVLRVMSEQKSYKRIAQEQGMTLDRFKEAKKNLKHKRKH